MSRKDDDVFVDAEEDFTPRRSSRKRRSTAGASVSSSCKKLKPGKKMPTERSPGKAPLSRKPATTDSSSSPKAPPEASTSPDAFWTKMGGMLGSMESRLLRETESVKDELGHAIGDLRKRVDCTEKRLGGLADEVHSIVDKRLATAMGRFRPESDPVGESGGDSGPTTDHTTSYASVASVASSKPGALRPRRSEKRQEDIYWECRRSVRLRPILEGEDQREVERFLRDHLCLDDNQIGCLGPFTVRRVPFGPAAKVKHEAVVTYLTVEARDVVKGAARKLAGKSSEYGVRLEIPNTLKSAMSALQSVAYDIKKKFPASRRNVLFDDTAMDLVLDFCIAESQDWKRMSSKQARERKKRNPGGREHVSEGELDGLLAEENNSL